MDLGSTRRAATYHSAPMTEKGLGKPRMVVLQAQQPASTWFWWFEFSSAEENAEGLQNTETSLQQSCRGTDVC